VYKIYDFEGTPSTPPPGIPDKYDLDEEILIYRGFTHLEPTEVQVKAWATANNGIAELISWSYAEDGDYIFPDPEATESDIDMVYHNLFPCIDFSADFIFHYTGTIPAKIDTAQIFPILYDINYPDSEELAVLWGMYKTNPTAGFGMWVEAFFVQGVDNTGKQTDDIKVIVDWMPGKPVDVGTQLHACDYVYVKLTIHLPQHNDWQGLVGAFGGKISVIQWHDDCIDIK
jgi:hypothetical protein